MGMFDDIRLEIDCPKCGEKVSGFQSKDGICCLSMLDYWEVDNFYTSCDKCKLWIEFNRKIKRKQCPLSDYEMKTKEQ